MNIVNTAIPDVLIIEPKVFGDARGFFYESFNQQRFNAAVGQNIEFVQDNHSLSAKGVLRGLHFQIDPMQQGKLVRVVRGEVFDVAVDIRPDSPTFRRWVGVNLSAENNRQMWIPRGFAHGFLVLSEQAEFLYKTDNYYSPENERSIRWDDPSIGIEWPLAVQPNLSQKDAIAPALADVLG
ncbi:dTDP-4-dehydrorhamnose 3,5-epimerase [Paraburkholderia sp. D15]|uniref:dTDP-4-dehydrorhamnose 3,5-epimerase n=1 Tax=Paraburkholderia sp. D15 TaxID=2880218 RepID=UPI002479A9F6|nr:dTDP-4-dehydrorhamnose 3,5-epimerase [Paraburkholderia sp. D15]WGS50616.1 dTDP-4-dehydrorhamnose 3,5-epimerase [Paraburkholderia sp. D15]